MAPTVTTLPPAPYRRLLNETVMMTTQSLLEKLPLEYSLELELSIQRSVREGLLHYSDGLDTLARQLRPLEYGGKARA